MLAVALVTRDVLICHTSMHSLVHLCVGVDPKRFPTSNQRSLFWPSWDGSVATIDHGALMNRSQVAAWVCGGHYPAGAAFSKLDNSWALSKDLVVVLHRSGVFRRIYDSVCCVGLLLSIDP